MMLYDDESFVERLCFYLTEFCVYNHDDSYLVRNKCDKMINDLMTMVGDRKYFEKFKNTILSLSNFDNKLCVRYSNSCFILIIHTIIEAYHHSKNFEDFCCVVDDIYQLDCEIDREDRAMVLRILFLNKYMRDLVSIQNYKDMSNLRRLMIEILKNPNECCYIGFFSEIAKILCSIYDEENPYLCKVADARIGNLLDRKKDNNVSKLFCSQILLYGNDRFFYINNKLLELESNYYRRMEIHNYIGLFNKDFFDDLNQGKEEDSFIECMEKVFDSDSYQELFSKLDLLKKLNDIYESGYVEEAKSRIGELDEDRHKEVYLGKVVSYPVNTMNKVIKPKRIIDRMKYLYSRIDSSISYDFMEDINSSIFPISVFNGALEKRIEEEKKPFNMLKRKVKNIKIFNKGVE